VSLGFWNGAYLKCYLKGVVKELLFVEEQVSWNSENKGQEVIQIKKVIKDILLYICSLVASQCLFYYFIDEYSGRFLNQTTITNIGMRVFVATLIYVITNAIIEKEFRKGHLDLLMIMYFLTVIALSFFRIGQYDFMNYNFNPISIIQDFKNNFSHSLFTFLGNLFIYVPLGCYVRYKFNSKPYYIGLMFIGYITLLEIGQYILKCGVFDVNDIILNFIGFYLGLKILDNIKHEAC